MSLQKTKPVRAASKRQYNAAGGEVQVLGDDIHDRRKAEQGD